MAIRDSSQALPGSPRSCRSSKAVIVMPRHDSALRISAAYIRFKTARSPKAWTTAFSQSCSVISRSASAYDDATVSVPAPAAFGVSVRRIESEEPSTRRKSGHEPAPFGTTRTTRHYVAQDQPLHVVVGGCALSSEGVCILGFRPDLHRVQGAVATWVKTGENPAAARRAGGKRGGIQGPCGCARGTPSKVVGGFPQRLHPSRPRSPRPPTPGADRA